MNDAVDLDKHRGMAAQKATDIRRVLAEVETNAKILRERQGDVEMQLLAVPSTSWAEAAAKARYVLNLYAADLAISSRRYWPTLPGSPIRSEPDFAGSK
jgi:hypothetical protein